MLEKLYSFILIFVGLAFVPGTIPNADYGTNSILDGTDQSET